ncbi:MAG: ATP-binding protein [Lachnospiraceae bacterium]|nr:ATP-binding protein [Lachnospiraceae bacterium]
MLTRERYMRQIRDFMDKPVIKVLTGMRRSGKSALLELTREELLARGTAAANIIHINFESLRYEKLKEYHALYEEISSRADKADGKVYILLDEIQEVSGWEQVVNSLRVDFECDIYITGSNARLLSGELATLLAGRYVEIQVYPLDFNEYLEFAAANPDEAGLSEREHFANYLRFGGLPGIHQMKWEESRIMQYLTDIYNSVLLKDVIARNRIRDTALLESIIPYLMDNVGNTFSAKTISDFLKSQGRKLSTETVYNYLKALEGAFLIHKASRFDIKGKRLLETQEKYYLSDLGMRHAVMGYRDNDIAGLLENVVYLELLRRGYSVNIGKQDVAEVDFVANRGDERIYIQVCYVLTEENTVREFAPLEAIADNYEKIVVSTDSLISFNRGGIRQKNVIDFLMGK